MYEKTISEMAASLRAMAKRVRHAEAQLSRRRGVPCGTTAEREARTEAQLWWDTDLNAFMANFGDGWEPVKDVRTGTTAEREAYPAANAGEFWWDTTEDRLYVWEGASWESTDIAESGTAAQRIASSPEPGQWWLDTDDKLVYVYDAIEWKPQISSRYIDPFMLLSETYGLFPFVPFRFMVSYPPSVVGNALVNIMDYAYYTTVSEEDYNHYRMNPYNSPVHGDNGHIPYLNFVASSSQYCDTKNYGTTGDLALLAWVSPDTASNIMPIIDKWYETSSHRCYRLVLWSDNTFRAYISANGTTATDYVATSVLTSNEVTGWNFIAVRFDAGSVLKIFHNGAWTSFGGSVPASIHDHDDDILVGKSNAASPVYFDGQMSVVAICKSAISDDIVEYIYESTKYSYIPQPEPQPSDSISVSEDGAVARTSNVTTSDSVSVGESVNTS